MKRTLCFLYYASEPYSHDSNVALKYNGININAQHLSRAAQS